MHTPSLEFDDGPWYVVETEMGVYFLPFSEVGIVKGYNQGKEYGLVKGTDEYELVKSWLVARVGVSEEPIRFYTSLGWGVRYCLGTSHKSLWFFNATSEWEAKRDLADYYGRALTNNQFSLAPAQIEISRIEQTLDKNKYLAKWRQYGIVEEFHNGMHEEEVNRILIEKLNEEVVMEYRYLCLMM